MATSCTKNPFDLLDSDGDDDFSVPEPAPVVTAPWLAPASQKGKKDEEKKKAAEATKKKKKAEEKTKQVEEEMRKKRDQEWKKKETEEKDMTLAEYEKKKAAMEALRKSTEQRKVVDKDFEKMKVVVGRKKEEVVFGLSSQPNAAADKQKLKKKVHEKNEKLPKPITAEEFQKKYGTSSSPWEKKNAASGEGASSSQSPAEEENAPNVADATQFPGLSTAATNKSRGLRAA